MIDTRLYINNWCCARGILVYLISDETNEIGGCTIEAREAEWKEKGTKKKRRRKSKEAWKLAQSFSGVPNPPQQQFAPASVIRVYIGFSISIYNTPHAAAVGRKSHRAENGFSWEMWRVGYAHNTTYQRFDDIMKLKRQVLSIGPKTGRTIWRRESSFLCWIRVTYWIIMFSSERMYYIQYNLHKTIFSQWNCQM